MESNAILFWAVFVLATISFFVLLFLSSKTWKIVHVFAMLLVYGAGFAACIYLSMSLKTNANWKQRVGELQKALDEAQKNKEELEVGKINTVAQAEGSRIVLPQQLWRATFKQGLVLRGCEPGNFNGTVALDTTKATSRAAGPAPAEGGARPVVSNGLAPKMILHAFKEQDFEGKKIPRVYLGEFEVTAANDTNATLSPALPLDKFQDSQVRAGGATWALYSELPHDNHYAFADPEAQDPLDAAKEAVRAAEQALTVAKQPDEKGAVDSGKVQSAQNNLKQAQKKLDEMRAKAHPLFGRSLSREELARLLPPKNLFSQFIPQDASLSKAENTKRVEDKYEQYLERYLHDGRPVKEIEADDNTFDVAGDTFQKVRFKLEDKKPYEVVVDAPAADGPFDDKGVFDVEGRALPDRLRQGAPTRFTNEYDIAKRFADPATGPTTVDDIGIFDQATADKLVDNNLAERLDDQFYVRPLRDYEFVYHDFFRRAQLLDEERLNVIAETKRISAATTLAQSQVDVRKDQKAKLQSDRDGFARDLAEITRQRTQLESQQQAQVARLRELFVGINQEYVELNRLHKMLVEEAAKRAAMASAGGGGGGQ